MSIAEVLNLDAGPMFSDALEAQILSFLLCVVGFGLSSDQLFLKRRQFMQSLAYLNDHEEQSSVARH